MDMIIGLVALLVEGVVLIALTLMISWWMNERMDQRQSNDDNDIRIYHLVRNRDHRSVGRNNPRYSEKEMIAVLNECKRYSCKYEQEVLTEVIHIIEKGEDDGK